MSKVRTILFVLILGLCAQSQAGWVCDGVSQAETNAVSTNAGAYLAMGSVGLSSLNAREENEWGIASSNLAMTPQSFYCNLTAFSNRLWFVGGYNGANNEWASTVWYADRGTNWVRAVPGWPSTFSGSTSSKLDSMTLWSNLLWMTCQQDGSGIWSSPDGVSWSFRSAHPDTSLPWPVTPTLIGYGNALWYISGSHSHGGKVYRSYEGTNWTLVATNPVGTAMYSPTLLDYGGKLWMLGHNTGYMFAPVPSRNIYHTTNGADWVCISNTAFFGSSASAWVDDLNRMVVWSSEGTLWASTNGTEWVNISSNNAMISGACAAAYFRTNVWVFEPAEGRMLKSSRTNAPGSGAIGVRGESLLELDTVVPRRWGQTLGTERWLWDWLYLDRGLSIGSGEVDEGRIVFWNGSLQSSGSVPLTSEWDVGGSHWMYDLLALGLRSGNPGDYISSDWVVVVGNGNVDHGEGSVTASSLWEGDNRVLTNETLTLAQVLSNGATAISPNNKIDLGQGGAITGLATICEDPVVGLTIKDGHGKSAFVMSYSFRQLVNTGGVVAATFTDIMRGNGAGWTNIVASNISGAPWLNANGTPAMGANLNMGGFAETNVTRRVVLVAGGGTTTLSTADSGLTYSVTDNAATWFALPSISASTVTNLPFYRFVSYSTNLVVLIPQAAQQIDGYTNRYASGTDAFKSLEIQQVQSNRWHNFSGRGTWAIQ